MRSSVIALTAFLVGACCAAIPIDAATPVSNLTRIVALENQVAVLNASLFGTNPVTHKPIESPPGQPGATLLAAQDGASALTEVRELRGRVFPLFANGDAANAKMIQCFNKTCP